MILIKLSDSRPQSLLRILKPRFPFHWRTSAATACGFESIIKVIQSGQLSIGKGTSNLPLCVQLRGAQAPLLTSTYIFVVCLVVRFLSDRSSIPPLPTHCCQQLIRIGCLEQSFLSFSVVTDATRLWAVVLRLLFSVKLR